MHNACVNDESDECDYFVNCVVVLKHVFSFLQREKVFAEVGEIFESASQAECNHEHRKQKQCHSAGVVQRARHEVLAAFACGHGEHVALVDWSDKAVDIIIVAETVNVGWLVVLHFSTVGCCCAVSYVVYNMLIVGFHSFVVILYFAFNALRRLFVVGFNIVDNLLHTVGCVPKIFVRCFHEILVDAVIKLLQNVVEETVDIEYNKRFFI